MIIYTLYKNGLLLFLNRCIPQKIGLKNITYTFYFTSSNYQIMKTLLSICLVLLSCSKESTNQTCYDCKYALTNGVQKPDDVRCTDGEQPGQTYDILGNPIGQQCTRR